MSRSGEGDGIISIGAKDLLAATDIQGLARVSDRGLSQTGDCLIARLAQVAGLPERHHLWSSAGISIDAMDLPLFPVCVIPVGRSGIP